MNFNRIYQDSKKRILDTYLSIHANGNPLLQEYLTELLESEKIMGEPVFQNSFPWTVGNKDFGQLTELLKLDFIDKLDRIPDKDFRFPKDRKPYKHQIESWLELLKEKKSIAVTTGTGSGKTECFMLPVLHDLYENAPVDNDGGIRAIFLYPLNALMKSQRDRIHAWSKALGSITYAVYNGNTKDTVNASEKNKAFPQLLDRVQIRETPPQVLFTNPSMLEYLLVRNLDVPILEKSQGKLRWIVLDEAHTFKGAGATDMALQIRRLIDAFGVTADDVRFVITSATVGSDVNSQEKLKEFMSALCGISTEKITIISGKREFYDISDKLNKEFGGKLKGLREKLYREDSLPLMELTNDFLPNGTIEERLVLVDKIVDIEENGQSILPLRGHFFTKAIGGLYACTNKTCTKHDHFVHKSPLGVLTTYADSFCDNCNSPMLELVMCKNCDNIMFSADKYKNRDGSDILQAAVNVSYDPFFIDTSNEEEEDENNKIEENKTQSSKVYFSRLDPAINYDIEGREVESKKVKKTKKPNTGPTKFNIQPDGTIQYTSASFDYIQVVDGQNSNTCRCPICASKVGSPYYFRLPMSFINRNLSDVILEHLPDMDPEDKSKNSEESSILWRGHKYITFTDSRQGTAKLSALTIIDMENYWVSSVIYQKLIEMNRGVELTKEQREKYLLERAELVQIIKTLDKDLVKDLLENKKLELDLILNGTSNKEKLSWKDAQKVILNKEEIEILVKRTSNNKREIIEDYSNALMYSNFCRRSVKAPTLENLGLVTNFYPDIDKLSRPNVAIGLGIKDEEWKMLVKIGLDYIVRFGYHIILPQSFKSEITELNINSSFITKEKWPVFNRNHTLINRVSLLLCAGLGYSSLEEISSQKEQDINELLEELWLVISTRILVQDEKDNSKFKLDISERTSFGLPEQVWLCPVKKRLIDVHFRGFSPWIKGRLSEANINRFRIKDVEKSLTFPIVPKALLGEKVIEERQKWIDEKLKDWKELGIWNDIYERILFPRPLYLAGEHSAQQDVQNLELLESQFKTGQLNILHCSTTMEMGVDISGISAVVMSNVPPAPANYLQRAGRAGRRGEAKSLALTICSPTPTGLHVLENTQWALKHEIAPPRVLFNSQKILDRHISAYFFSQFMQDKEIRTNVKGMSLRTNVEEFFFKNKDESKVISVYFQEWLEGAGGIETQRNLSNVFESQIINFSLQQNILLRVIKDFENVCVRVNRKINEFDKRLKKEKEDSIYDFVYNAIKNKRDRYLQENVIGFLSTEGFLPSGGIVTDVVEFEIRNINNFKRTNLKNPQRDVITALHEFAPGNRIVLDNRNYYSRGIIMQNVRGEQAKREVIQGCSSCGHQRVVIEEQGINDECECCVNGVYKGMDGQGKFSEMIQPAGYATAFMDKDTRQISEANTNVYTEPLLLNVGMWTEGTSGFFQTRQSDDIAQIMYYNRGQGEGYDVCLHCGRTTFTNETDSLKNHIRLRGQKDGKEDRICTGNYENGIRRKVVLGAALNTDLVEVRINDEAGYSNDESLIQTLAMLLTKKLAVYLAIEESELSFGIKSYNGYRTFFIYDTKKGGANYAVQFAMYANEVLKLALEELQCSCINGCTKCLVDRKSQWKLEKIAKEKAKQWVQMVVNRVLPDHIKLLDPSISFVDGNFWSEIRNSSFTKSVSTIRLFVDEHIDQWNEDDLTSLMKLKQDRDFNIEFLFIRKPNLSDSVVLNKLAMMSGWSSFFNYTKDTTKFLEQHPVGSILFKEGKEVFYFGEGNINYILNKDWGITNSSTLYKVVYSLTTLEKIDILNEFKFIKDVYVFSIGKDIEMPESKKIASNKIADIVLDGFQKKLGINSLLEGKKVDITYSDRYVRNPFTSIVMMQFIQGLKNRLDLSINKLEIVGNAFQKKGNEEYRPGFINDFYNSEARDHFIEKVFQIENISNQLIIESFDIEEIEHSRSLVITTADVTLKLMIDGGIAHGWGTSRNIDKKIMDFFKKHNFLRDSYPDFEEDELFDEIDFINDTFLINKRLNDTLIYTLQIIKK